MLKYSLSLVSLANPKYRGKFRAPLIDNPNYQGKWAPRRIPNPDYFEDLNPFKMTPIAAIGIELWSMSNNILFDNLLITDGKYEIINIKTLNNSPKIFFFHSNKTTSWLMNG